MIVQPDFAQVKVTPVKLVCDTSGSMDSQVDASDPASERRIDGLNRGLVVGAEFMRNHRLLSRSAMIGITTIDEPINTFPFEPAASFQPPTLQAHASTPLGQALERACDKIAEFLHRLNADGRPYNTTTMLIFTDGAPNGESPKETQSGIDRVKALEAAKQVFVIPAGLTRDDCHRLDAMGFQWEELFRIVTASAGAIAGGQRPMLP
jgi:uncharacterized protein YegL